MGCPFQAPRGPSPWRHHQIRGNRYTIFRKHIESLYKFCKSGLSDRLTPTRDTYKIVRSAGTLGTRRCDTVKHVPGGLHTLRFWHRGLAAVAMAAVFGAATPSFGASLNSELAGLLGYHPQIKAGQKAVQSTRAQIQQALATISTSSGLVQQHRPRDHRRTRAEEPRTRSGRHRADRHFDVGHRHSRTF